MIYMNKFPQAFMYEDEINSGSVSRIGSIEIIEGKHETRIFTITCLDC